MVIKARNYSFSYPRVNIVSPSLCVCAHIHIHLYLSWQLKGNNHKVVISEFPTPGHKIDSPSVPYSTVPADEKPELAHHSVFETGCKKGKKSSTQRMMIHIFPPWGCFQIGEYRGREVDYRLLIAQGIKGSSKHKQRNNMGEIRKHRDGLSQCRDSLALQSEWKTWGSSNSSPWSDNIWTHLAHTKLESVLSLHSLAAARHRFPLPASRSQLLGVFGQPLCVTMWRSVWH